MGHQGKHLIDPETGLCEICDKGAIEQVQQGRAPGKKIVYTTLEDDSIEPLNIDEVPHTKDRRVYEAPEKSTPRFARRSIHVAPAVQTRRVVYQQPIEEPVVVRRKVVPAERTPERVVVHRSPPARPPPARRSSTYYYVDDDNQMIPQGGAPPKETPRRYVVQRKEPPTARTVRVIRRRIQTPPPPSSEAWHTGPRRMINSDTEIVQRQQRMRRNEANESPTPQIRPEVYYLEAAPNHVRRTPIETPVYGSRDENIPPTPPPRMAHRRPTRVDPLPERRNPRPVEPVVVKRVYKNYAQGRPAPPDHHLVSDENHPPPARRNARNLPPPSKHYQTPPESNNRYPPSKQYRSPPESNNRYPPSKQYRAPPESNNQEAVPAKKPSIFYIRNREEYD